MKRLLPALAVSLAALGACVALPVAAAAASSRPTLVSCLNASGLAIGTYDNNKNPEPNGDLVPTTLPANYNFAADGAKVGEFVVVKGEKLPLASPNPKKGTPVFYVIYGPGVKREGPDGPGLVLIGYFMVAWQHEPQSEAAVVISCVMRYGVQSVDTAQRQRQQYDTQWFALYQCLSNQPSLSVDANTNEYYGVTASNGRHDVAAIEYSPTAAQAAARANRTHSFVIANVEYVFSRSATNAEVSIVKTCFRRVYSATTTTAPHPMTPTESMLASMLLTPSQMPLGWNVAHYGTGGSDCLHSELEPTGIKAAASADVAFNYQSSLPTLGEKLVTYPTPAGTVFTKIVAALDRCRTVSLGTFHGHKVTGTVSKMSFPAYGDQSVTFSMSYTVAGVAFYVDDFVAQKGEVIVAVTEGGAPGRPPKLSQIETFVRQAIARLP